jgi:galactose mutarotase-like enzyme
MPSLTTRASGVPAIGELLVLADEQAESRVELAPARGALVTSFSVGGRELLYLDRATLADPSKNVRGGNPVLFPSPGRLTGDAFMINGRAGALKQHGFARALPWRPGAVEDTKNASVTLTLSSSELTRAQYPFDFVFELRFSLRGTCLTLGLRVHNPGEVPLPFAVGFHPYFAIADKARARIDTRATRIFDNVTKSLAPFHGFDLTAPELDVYLLDHGSCASALRFADGTRIDVRASAEFTRWVVWTVAGKDYVCLEPWSAPPDALNTGEGLLQLAPGAVHEGFVEFELV